MSAVSRFALGSVLAVLIAVAVIDAQTELDHIVSRVNGRIITQSDVNQARLLRLVPDASSDDAVRVALENRLLILGGIARGNALPPANGSGNCGTACGMAAWRRRQYRRVAREGPYERERARRVAQRRSESARLLDPSVRRYPRK